MNKYIFQIFVLYNIILSFVYSIKNLRPKRKIKEEDEQSKLLFVWEQFRHGARGPWISVDPITGLDFIGEKWTRMHYLLGASMKKKYNNFLSKQFNPNEIYIISTDVNRTMMSSYAHLQGMYNNSTSSLLTDKQINLSFIQNSNYSSKINDKIYALKNNSVENGINLFPVYLYPNNYGKEFLLYEPDICPKIVKYLDNAKNSETMKKIYNETSEKLNKTCII